MEHVENAQALTRIFDCWPSFHDGELLEVHLNTAGTGAPSLAARFHLFEYTPDVDDSGHYILKNHTEAELEFTEVRLHDLRDFREGNIVLSLDIEPIDPDLNEGRLLKVTIAPSYGCAAEFDCRKIVVRSVVPHAPAA